MEALWLSLSPAPRETLHYVNLEGEGAEPGGGAIRAPGAEEVSGAGAPSWSAPWQRSGAEQEEREWLMMGSGVALAIGGDYRYIINPCGGEEEEGEREEGHRPGRRSMDCVQDEEDDVVINV